MRILFVFLILTVINLLNSCQSGCTDCNALNFDPNAQNDDNSCVYENDQLIGVYDVLDSTMAWTQQVSYDHYQIELKRGGCNPNGLIIVNYANLTNHKTDSPFEVSVNIEGDTIRIPYQFIEGDDIQGSSFHDFEINEITGYFVGDSIYFPLSYNHNNGDPSSGYCIGKRIE